MRVNTSQYCTFIEKVNSKQWKQWSPDTFTFLAFEKSLFGNLHALFKSFETSTTFEVRKSLIDNLEEVKNNLHLETFKFTISLLQNWKKDFQSKCTCFLKQAGKKFRVTWFLLVYKLRRKKSTFWTNIPSKMVPIYCCHLGQCNYYYNF
jgi:hypothetical protein